MSQIAFLGAGRMATAMVSGILEKQFAQPGDIGCTSAADGSGEALADRLGIRCESDLEALLAPADVVILAFKPQQLEQMSEHHAALTTGKLVLSILAGATIARLREKFPDARNIVRAMPNTPGQIGAGITAFTPQTPLTDADAASVQAILGSMGPVLTVPESDLDAVTAVSGSGPAYVFEFVAALREGGIAAGLAPEIAAQLAIETVLGSARLLVRTGEEPETLRNAVSSPGGTTLAGLAIMEKRDFRGVMKDTVLAARQRSVELSKG